MAFTVRNTFRKYSNTRQIKYVQNLEFPPQLALNIPMQIYCGKLPKNIKSKGTINILLQILIRLKG